MVLSQGIHFWCYFGDLTPKTQNKGPNYPILGQNRVKIDFFLRSFSASHKLFIGNLFRSLYWQEKAVIE